jgi:hypothetical protein
MSNFWASSILPKLFHVSSVVTNGFHASEFSGFESNASAPLSTRDSDVTSRYTSADEISRRKKGSDASTRTNFAFAAGSMGGGSFLARRFLFGAGAGAGGAMPASASRFCWRVRVMVS